MTATSPDPRFRDKLLSEPTAVGDMAEDWWCPKREGVRRTECRYCIAEFTVDALLPLIAAEVEARVQAAAGQRAAEELTDLADWIRLSVFDQKDARLFFHIDAGEDVSFNDRQDRLGAHDCGDPTCPDIGYQAEGD